MTDTAPLDLPAVLAALTTTGVIQWSRVDDDDIVCVSLVLTYLDPSDPSRGYDAAGKAHEGQVIGALKALGYSFSDGGFEDAGAGVTGEWWIFRRTGTAAA